MDNSYSWPVPPGFHKTPIWRGDRFELDGQHLSVLQYKPADSNWSESLTDFHEKTAGENHFIDVSSQVHALATLRKHLQSARPVILEAGCSSGFLLKQVKREFPEAMMIGSDFIVGPLERLAKEVCNLPLLQFDLTRCPLPDASLDAVFLLNVLEHIKDDLTAVQQVYRILKPGGVAIIEAPAGPNLYDVYDKFLMHWRRYSLAHLCDILVQAGFEVVEKSHLGCFLYPAFWWGKWRNRRYLTAGAETQRLVAAENIRHSGQIRWLRGLMQFEIWMGRWVRYPIGIRCLATCRKSKNNPV